MDRRCRINLFGGLHVQQGNQSWTRFRTQKAGALLAYLAFYGEKTHSREPLIEMLWPDVTLEIGRNRLNVTLHVLRSHLATPDLPKKEFLLTDRHCVRINPTEVSTDVADFEAGLCAVEAAVDTQTRIECLEKVCACYRGPLLPDFYDEWIAAERTRLAKQFVQASRQLAAQWEAQGNVERALQVAHRAVQEDPLNEEVCRDMMRLYMAAEQPAAALRQYYELERQLKEQLDLTPSDQTRRWVETLRVKSAQRLPVSNSPTVSDNPVSDPVPDPIPEPQTAAPPAALPTPPVPSGHQHTPPLINKPQPSDLSTLPVYTSRSVSALAPFSAIENRTENTARRVRLLLISVVALLPALIFLRTHPSWVAATNALPRPVANVGKELWVVPYNHETDEKSSEPDTLVTDDAGNIYVTGIVQTREHDADILTLKYSPDGRLIWRNRYNGPGNDCDRPFSIAVDKRGNVYVAGESYNGDRREGKTEWDTTLLKYAPDGTLLWNQHYDVPSSNDERAVKVVPDNAGYVYIGGWSRDAQKRKHFLTLKYDEDGDLNWARLYNPPPQIGNAVASEVYDMVVDDAKNITLTGQAEFNDRGEARTTTCALTLRYDHSGNLLWPRRYSSDPTFSDKAWRIALAKDASLYIAGTGVPVKVTAPNNAENQFLTHYDTQGNEQWTARPETLYFPNILVGMTLDSSGNIIISGVSGFRTWSTQAFDAKGKPIWKKDYTPKHTRLNTFVEGLAADGMGNVIVMGREQTPEEAPDSRSWDTVTFKYDANGRELWQRRYRAVLEGDRFCPLAVDRTGNVFVAVASSASNGITLIKYSP